MVRWRRSCFQAAVPLVRYISGLTTGKLVLWCYLVWYLTMASLYFDPAPGLWLSSLGMSGIIGAALILSTRSSAHRPDGWTVFRLFLMPFCVSSYAALIKGRGFFLIFPPEVKPLALGLAACAAVVLLRMICRRLWMPLD